MNISNSKIPSIYIILSKFLFKMHFLQDLSIGAQVQPFELLIFEICVLLPILYWLDLTFQLVVQFSLPASNKDL